MSGELETIGILRSPFREKFGVPRQPGLLRGLRCELEIRPEFSADDFWRGLDEFSHLWLVWRFHLDEGRGGRRRPTVRPPRLGGEERRGVFATRSGFRPNGLGLSLVRLRGLRRTGNAMVLELGAADLVDGTPVVDVKPYLAWAEARPDAEGGFAAEPPSATREVVLNARVRDQIAARSELPDLEEFIVDLLSLDPRPAWDRREVPEDRVFGIRLHDFDLRWREVAGRAEVLELAALREEDGT